LIKNLIIIAFINSISFTALASKLEYEYKEVDSFETLSEYANTEQFEQSYQNYIQDCLDHSGGGAGGIRCLIDYEIWDRELNIYYRKLHQVLDNKGKDMLKTAQLAWIEKRDLSIDFNSYILDLEYEGKIGTMYLLMRAGDANRVIAKIVKQRALLLKKWYERAKSL